MSKIVFITTLPLWSMEKGRGGPAFTQTVKKYIDEGWEVFLISDEPSNADYTGLDAGHNIVLQPSRFKKYGQIQKLGQPNIICRLLPGSKVPSCLNIGTQWPTIFAGIPIIRLWPNGPIWSL